MLQYLRWKRFSFYLNLVKFEEFQNTSPKSQKTSERLDVFSSWNFSRKVFFHIKTFLKNFLHKSCFSTSKLSLPKLPRCGGGALSGLPVLRAPDASARSTSVRLVTKWDAFFYFRSLEQLQHRHKWVRIKQVGYTLNEL